MIVLRVPCLSLRHLQDAGWLAAGAVSCLDIGRMDADVGRDDRCAWVERREEAARIGTGLSSRRTRSGCSRSQ